MKISAKATRREQNRKSYSTVRSRRRALRREEAGDDRTGRLYTATFKTTGVVISDGLSRAALRQIDMICAKMGLDVKSAKSPRLHRRSGFSAPFVHRGVHYAFLISGDTVHLMSAK